MGTRATSATFAHPIWLVAAALVAGAAALGVALQDPVPTWELRLTEWFNGAPDAVAVPLYPVMQVGTLAAPLVVAAFVLAVRRDGVLAAAVLAGGLVAWFGAKGVKRLVERGRPLEYLPDIHVREGSGTGLGFISGHSAVAAFTMVALAAAVDRRWRPAVVAVAVLVGVARLVYGVHLPADVVGGWAFGAIAGVATVEIVDRIRGRSGGPTAPEAAEAS